MAQLVIVGGGVVGLCTAHALRRRGYAVTVLDAGPPERAASHGNAGWIVPSLAGPVPAPGLVQTSLRWMMRSDSPLYVRPRADPAFLRWLLAFWRRCNERDYRTGLAAVAALGVDAMARYDALRADGVALEEHRDGLVFAYRSRAELEHDHANLDLLRPFGYDPTPLLDGATLRELEPALAVGLAGGYWLAGERHVRPDSLVAGLRERLRADGVEIRCGTTVTGFEHTRGRVTAAVTTDGRAPAEAVVVCAGAWTGELMRRVGVRVPIEAGKGYSLDYAPPPTLPHPIGHALYLHEARVAVTPLAGMVRLAGTMELSGLHQRIAPARVAAIARAGARYLAGWPAEAKPSRTWTGARPLTPDGLPVIGPAPGFANLIVASGHAMLGVTLAPATAAAVADLIATGRAPEVIRPFAPARFARW